MRINKNDNVILWANFANQEGVEAVLADTPIITILHYSSGIVLDIDEVDMVNIDHQLWNYEFSCSLDTIYCAIIKAEYEDGTSVQMSQIFISGKPSQLAIFVDFVNQEQSAIETTNQQFQVFQNNAIIQAWANMTQAIGSVYYGLINQELEDDVYLAQFKADYDGLSIIGDYVFGGMSGGSGSGASGNVVVTPQTANTVIQPNIANVYPTKAASGIVINPNTTSIRKTKANTPQINIKSNG